MNTKNMLKTCLLAAALTGTAWAQNNTTDANGFNADWGPRTGDRELTLGGGGGSNKDFDSSFAGVNASYGQFLTDQWEVSLRQAVNYTNPRGAESMWNAATRIAGDYHFLPGSRFRPFVGGNIGGVYGEGVQDTWVAGIEAGGKYYVRPKTFVFAMAEYEWFFKSASKADNNFNDGQFIWSTGIGFHF